MFILMSGLSNCPSYYSTENKIKHTVKTGGLAITITSLTDFLAFSIGTMSSFPVVRYFCIYAGMIIKNKLLLHLKPTAIFCVITHPCNSEAVTVLRLSREFGLIYTRVQHLSIVCFVIVKF